MVSASPTVAVSILEVQCVHTHYCDLRSTFGKDSYCDSILYCCCCVALLVWRNDFPWDEKLYVAIQCVF